MGIKTDRATQTKLAEANKKGGHSNLKRTAMLEGAKILTINPSK